MNVVAVSAALAPLAFGSTYAVTTEFLPPDRPLETVAERRPLPFAFGTEPISFDLRLTLGRRWLRLLARASGFRDAAGQFVLHWGNDYWLDGSGEVVSS